MGLGNSFVELPAPLCVPIASPRKIARATQGYFSKNRLALGQRWLHVSLRCCSIDLLGSANLHSQRFRLASRLSYDVIRSNLLGSANCHS